MQRWFNISLMSRNISCCLVLGVLSALVLASGCATVRREMDAGADGVALWRVRNPSASTAEIRRHRSELQERVETYIDAHSEMSAQHIKYLRWLEVAKGMSQEQVLLVLAEPDRRTQADDPLGSLELWIYDLHHSDWRYELYFRKEILVRIVKHASAAL